MVVYSEGIFGEQLMNRLKQANTCEVIGWVDDDYWEYRRCCMDVDPVERLSKDDFDYILVATIDTQLAERIKMRIADYGVNAQKILTINKEKESSLLINKYLL